MKIRNGFVSNSSSSSFVIDLKGLTKEQIKKIKQWIEESNDPNDYNNPKYSDDNSITISNKHVYGNVSYHVDFFDFLDNLHIPKDNIDSND